MFAVNQQFHEHPFGLDAAAFKPGGDQGHFRDRRTGRKAEPFAFVVSIHFMAPPGTGRQPAAGQIHRQVYGEKVDVAIPGIIPACLRA